MWLNAKIQQFSLEIRIEQNVAKIRDQGMRKKNHKAVLSFSQKEASHENQLLPLMSGLVEKLKKICSSVVSAML